MAVRARAKPGRFAGHTAASAAILLARAFPLAPLKDAATGLPLPGARLELSPAHLLLTPFTAWAERMACAGLWQHAAFVATAALLFALPGRRKPKAWALFAAGLLAFYAWLAQGPRPVSRLALDDKALLSVDIHSHSARSWDGQRSFTPAENAAWHAALGYDAAFLTDHNKPARTEDLEAGPGAALLAGQELSLYNAHIVALGPSPADKSIYDTGEPGVRRFLERSRARGGPLTVMSLPEHWRHGWDLATLADWGVYGFEIYTAAPKALDYPESERRRLVELCRSRGLFVAGASDNHGWARSACVWNLVRLPGWRGLGRERLEAGVIGVLRRGGYGAVVVAARAGDSPSSWAGLAVDTPRAAWTLLRTFTPGQVISVLLWIWLPGLVFSRNRR